MKPSNNRVIWKGAITFGLVHIPIALYSATSEQGLDFDWLDKRSMDPVGYKRINKKTGKEINKENIVKGIEYEDGQYIILSQEEISSANPESSQTIEIETFVPASDIPLIYLERPYYTAPINKGKKVYALLRETLIETKRAGIARVVIQTKQHLAALIPSGSVLTLNLLRWSNEIRSWEELNLPAEGIKGTGLTDKELKMAAELVKNMSSEWNPEDFHDTFKEEIMDLVKQKAKSGDLQLVSKPEQSEQPQGGAQIIDLAELLRNSLKKNNKSEDNKTPAKKSTKTTSKASPPSSARKKSSAS